MRADQVRLGGETAELRMRRATLIGFGAVLLWALLAPFTVGTGNVPPFLLTGFAFALAALIGLGVQIARGRPLKTCLAPSPRAWLLGVGGLFGFHALYFAALRLAPPVEASLIVYLWPLLIVVLSALLPGQRLAARHVLGALAGLAGTVLLVADGPVAFSGALLGYGVALAAAMTWSGYSVLNGRLARGVPTEAVTGFCAATAALAFGCHALFETTVMPEGGQWLALLALGLGPVGAAFFLWDHGTKHGDVRVLAASAYAAPLLSTLILVALDLGEPSLSLGLACVLIVGGAALASGELLRAGRAASAGTTGY